MNTLPEKTDYLLLFRNTLWEKNLPREQVREVVGDWYAWYDRLMREGKCSGGYPLLNEGRLISGKHGEIVSDGPFAESKEAIGGYFYLHVADEAEGIRIAQECPGLEYGCVVELRRIGERCGSLAEISEKS